MAPSAPIRVGIVGPDHGSWATSMIRHLVKDPRFALAACPSSRTGKAIRV
jgi:hypothetical protein